MNTSIFHSLSPEEFKELLQGAIREMLATDSLPKRHNEDDNSHKEKLNSFLTRKQTADLLQISLPTLHQYTKNGLITSFQLGNKVRYKESDIKAALKERNYGRRAS